MNQDRLLKIYSWGLVVVMAGVFLHAPLAIGFGSIFPDAALYIKAWKEILLVFLFTLGIHLVSVRHLWRELLASRVLQLCLLFAAVHAISLFFYFSDVQAVIAGLMIDLRFVLYFALCFVAARLHSPTRDWLVKAAIGGSVVVVVFGVLQITVLPDNFLTIIGCSNDTIAAYNTIDKNPDFVRIISTLRGPNPLGAISVVILSGIAAFSLMYWRKLTGRQQLCVAVAAAMTIAVLFASYSRSAYLAAALALAIIGVISIRKHFTPQRGLMAGALVLVLVVSGLALQQTDWYKNVILHEDPESSVVVKSNDAHIDSLEHGLDRLVSQPLGAGVGSTGSASLISKERGGTIIENYYLFVAHETGWLGLFCFMALFYALLAELWKRRSKDWLALALFASGIGLSVVALLLPVWADDTTALVWWGLAGSIIGGAYDGTRRTRQQKTTRTP